MLHFNSHLSGEHWFAGSPLALYLHLFRKNVLALVPQFFCGLDALPVTLSLSVNR